MDGTVHITGTDRGALPEDFACQYELVKSSSGLALTFSTAHAERACRWSSPSQEGISIGILLHGHIGFSPGMRRTWQFARGDGFLLASREVIETSHVVEQPTECRTVFLHLPERAMEEFQLACAACGMLRAKLADLAGGACLHRWTTGREAVALARQVATCPYTGPLRTLYLQGKALELLAVMLASADQNTALSSRNGRLLPAHAERLMAARDILVAEFNAPPSLDTLARRVGMSTSLLTAGFRRVFGVSVMAYVQEHRLNHAFAALKEGRINVSQAAYSAGYSRAHFSTLFRRKFGLAPRDLMAHDH